MKETLLILWMIFTFILCMSVIGWILFLPKDTYQNAPNIRSTWMQIGVDLKDSIINN